MCLAKGLQAQVRKTSRSFSVFFRGGFCNVFALFGSRSSVAPVFISASPSRTWAALCNPSRPCRSSPRSREPPHKVPEPKRPSPPPGRTTRWTSAWTSWVRGCSRPSPCSPPLTPSSKVRAAAELRRGLSLPHCMSFTIWHFHYLCLHGHK